MRTGDLVRFKDRTPDEEGLVFEVLEVRISDESAERCLVFVPPSTTDLFQSFTIRPTFLYRASDLELVAPCHACEWGSN